MRQKIHLYNYKSLTFLCRTGGGITPTGGSMLCPHLMSTPGGLLHPDAEEGSGNQSDSRTGRSQRGSGQSLRSPAVCCRTGLDTKEKDDQSFSFSNNI